jgi:tetratricopeptide (TPR) repeat protein
MTRPRERCAAILLGCATALAPEPVRAQEKPPPAAPAAAASDAEAAFRLGLERYSANDFTGAIGVWERLLGTIGEQRGWRVLYNLGLAYQQVGDVTRAIERYDAFLREAEARPGLPADALDERKRDAEERLRTLKAAYGAVHVRAPDTGEVVMVRVGTSDARPAGFTVYLAPGPRDVEIGTGSSRARRVQVSVVAGGSVDVDASLASPAPAAVQTLGEPTVEASQPPEAAHRFPTAWLLVGAGATAASFALPIALALRAQSKRDEAASLGIGNTGYAAALRDYEGARTDYYVSYALPGAIALATAIVVVLQAASTPSAQRALRAKASMETGGPGFWVLGRF